MALPISVVIPAYNAAPYLAETLESVAGQSMPAAETIVIDDGSTDGTGAIAESFGARVLHREHCGVSAARNAGILAATQPWIAFNDADDLWQSVKLELQWAALEACPEAGMVFSDYINFESSTGRPVNWHRIHAQPQYATVVRRRVGPATFLCEHGSFRDATVTGTFSLTTSLIVRRDLLIAAGLFRPELRGAEDQDLLLRLVTLTTAAVVELPLVRRRIHGAQLTADNARIQLYHAAVADFVEAEPHRYPARAAVWLPLRRLFWLRQAALTFMRRGEFADAEHACRRLLRCGFTVRRLIAYMVARSLRTLRAQYAYRALRGVKRTVRATLAR